MPHIIDIISTVLAVTLQCATLITVIYGFVKFTRKPTDDLNTRVTKLEVRADAQDRRLEAGDIHFKVTDETSHITQSALLTILDTFTVMDSVPDSAKAEIKSRRKEIYDYLTDK